MVIRNQELGEGREFKTEGGLGCSSVCGEEGDEQPGALAFAGSKLHCSTLHFSLAVHL
jgi:hypothetical protein